MNEFWIAALLLALFAGLLVLLPLRRGAVAAADPAGDARRAENLAAYRQQLLELEAARDRAAMTAEEFAGARLELDRRLLADTDAPGRAGESRHSGRGVLAACALAVPVLALLLYRSLGGADAMALDGLLAQLDKETGEPQRAALLERVLPMLEQQSRRGDPDGDYRYLLARLYTAGQRFPEAAALYAQLVDMYPEDAAVIAQAAQAQYLAAGRRVTPAVQSLIDRAFAIDPAQMTLLGLIGMDRFQAGDYRAALDYWQKLLDHLPPEAPDAGVIRDGIAMARSRLGESPPAADTPAADTPVAAATVAATGADAAAAGPRLQIAVSVSPQLRLQPGDTVFVFARAVDGPPMPLAVARFPASELPREVELSDAMAMAPGMKLSSFPRVSVTARISRQGGVSAQPGDLEGGGEALSLNGGLQTLEILIDRTL